MKQTLFNKDWEFLKLPIDRTIQDAKESADWARVDVPHDWLIYDATNLYETSMGFYRKYFTLKKQAGDVYFLRFEAIYQDSEIYLNGQKVGEWKYGYNTFLVDLNEALVDGENELLVSVRYESPNSRWYSGAGIIRDVYFLNGKENYLSEDGSYIRTVKVAERNDKTADYKLRLSTEVTLSEAALACTHESQAGEQESAKEKYILRYTVMDSDENILVEKELQNNIDRNQTLIFMMEGVREWSLEERNLYILQTELVHKDATGASEVLDVHREKFGFRTITMDPNSGLYLNGEALKLNGVCIHHDLGALGAAFHKEALRRQLEIQKAMGVNALRTSHNMPAREVLELADEMGFLVDDEMFDMWRTHKTDHDYATWFDDWMERDITNFVRRDRNHASLLMWSVGNEIYDTQANLEDGLSTIKKLRDTTLRSDPEKNGIVTFASNYMEGDDTQICADELKVVGYNYLERLYEKHHAAHPDWVIYGSETASTVQSRGVYHFPYEEMILVDMDEQCSSLGNCTTSWGAKNTEACIIADRDCKYSLGQFIWTGYDYIGEPTPYHTKNSYFGQVDTAGFPKDSYYMYQAEWTDAKTAPMVHLWPYWDFNPGQMVDVRACTNGAAVELFVNGKSLGKREIDHVHGTELAPHWKTAYEPGVIEAVAYNAKGDVIAREEHKSFGDAVAITSKVRSPEAAADGRGLFFIEVGMVDAAGNPVENANNRVSVHVEGPARLVGIDNGDSTDYDSYKGTSKRLFMGKLLVMVQTTQKAGYVVVTLSSEGMEKHRIYLTAMDCEKLEGIACEENNETCKVANPLPAEREHEIPIRKIEIHSAQGFQMNDDCREMDLEAVIYPANSTCKDIVWAAITDSGVETNLVQLTSDGCRAHLTAMGDGAFQVRCYTRNGAEKVNVISQIGIRIDGIGSAYLNPYELISASLYDCSEGEMQKALEHGIATARDVESYLGFTNVDFGAFGTDRITLPCFAFSSNKDYRIRIWDGIPNAEGSECLADGIYNKTTIWDTYIPETFVFGHRIKGIHTICIQTEEFINIKGFVCEAMNKGTSLVNAIEHDKIYGDAFEVGPDAVTGIGNNVSIEFSDMDFLEGVHTLVICGRSHIEKNTVHVKFTDENGNFTRQMVEIPYSEDYTEHTFELEPVQGKKDLTLIFLPGSNIDLKWFCFS